MAWRKIFRGSPLSVFCCLFSYLTCQALMMTLYLFFKTEQSFSPSWPLTWPPNTKSRLHSKVYLWTQSLHVCSMYFSHKFSIGEVLVVNVFNRSKKKWQMAKEIWTMRALWSGTFRVRYHLWYLQCLLFNIMVKRYNLIMKNSCRISFLY